MSNDDASDSNPCEEERLYRADVPVRLPPESLRQFSRWLDKQLAEMEARWAHWASPAAKRTCRPRRVKPLPR